MLGDSLPENVLIFPKPETLKEECAGYTPLHTDATPENNLISDTKVEVCSSVATFRGEDKDIVCDTVPDLSKHKKLFVDTETTGLDPYKDELILVQIGTGEEVFVIDAKKTDLSPLKAVLEDKKVLKVFHNAVFDVKFLKRRLGCEVRNIFDTFLAERLLTAGIGSLRDCSLEKVAKKYLDIELDKSWRTSFDQAWGITQEQADYAANDVKVLPGIFEKQKKKLKEKGLVDTADLEFSIVPAMADIELKGILLDKDKLEDIRKSLQGRIMDLETRLREFGPVNFSSPQQVLSVLKELGFTVENTSDKTLEGIEHPFAKTMLEHREVSKLFTSFAKKLPQHFNPATGRIHPDFLQLGTDTGRVSCQRPNLQQIPKDQEWRDLFVAPQGFKLITADYSQIELRILAEFSKDAKFIEAYKTGQDLHQRTADLIGITRDAAKAINFGLVYGMGPGGLSKRLGIKYDEAERFIEAYFRGFPKIKRCLEDLEAKPLTVGFTTTPLGRKRFFRPVESMKEHGELKRRGRNTPIQACCGDILKKAILLIAENLRGYEAGIVNMVHDELVIEAKDDLVEDIAKTVSLCMIEAGEEFIKSVPVEVNIVVDQRWKK